MVNMTLRNLVLSVVIFSIGWICSDASCVVRCMQSSKQGLDSEEAKGNWSRESAAERHRRSASIDIVDGATENLTDFCNSVYQPTAQCVHSCPDSGTLKKMTLKSLAVVEHICTKRLDELEPLWPCMKRVHDGMNSLCRSRCRRYETDMADIAVQLRRSGADYDKTSKGKILAVTCLFAHCKRDCESSMIESRCGSRARQLTEEILLVSVSSVKDMVNDGGRSNGQWPEQCIRLKMALVSSGSAMRSWVTGWGYVLVFWVAVAFY